MGLEILWFRHFSILLGGFRAVFSLLLSVILIGIGAGSLLSGFLASPHGRPAAVVDRVQALFVAATLLGLAIADARDIERVVIATVPLKQTPAVAVEVVLSAESGWARAFTELWFNARPICWSRHTGAADGIQLSARQLPSSSARTVGCRRAGFSIFRTPPAPCAALWPQGSSPPEARDPGQRHGVDDRRRARRGAALSRRQRIGAWRLRRPRPTPRGVAGSVVIGGAALGLWFRLPPDYVMARAAGAPGHRPTGDPERRLTEVIVVADVPNKGRTLFTNGHPMSSTVALSQRYMTCLAIFPLLLIDAPETVLVIRLRRRAYDAPATLHPSIPACRGRGLSEGSFASSYSKDVNGDVLNNRAGRVCQRWPHHLLMQPQASYDLITLEPPPIRVRRGGRAVFEGVLRLARARLKPKGSISQWLPPYRCRPKSAGDDPRVRQVSQAVRFGCRSGPCADGANDSRIEIIPARLPPSSRKLPGVKRTCSGWISAACVRSRYVRWLGAEARAEADRDSPPVSDDRPCRNTE